MANPFDQFDEIAPPQTEQQTAPASANSSASTSGGGNPFDQFDAEPVNTSAAKSKTQQAPQPLPKDIEGNPVKEQYPGEEAFRQLGLAGRDIAGAVPTAVLGLGDVANSAINSTTGLINKYGGTKIPQLGMPTDVVQKGLSATGAFPEYKNDTERNVGNAAAIVLGGGEQGFNTAREMAQNGAKYFDTTLNKAAQPVPTYDPMRTMRAVSDAFNTSIDKANTLYNFPQQLAEGQFVKAPQVKNYLGSVIDDVNDSIAPHEAKSQVGTLQRIYDNLPEDGTVPVSDLLDLRKFTNKFFDPARFTDKTATYGKFNSVIDSGLNTARQTVPNFDKALDIADDYWRNNVSQPFLKNKVLQKSWSPSDAHNLRMVDEGYLDEPSDLTAQRADNLVNNVKDVSSYNAVRRTLPDDEGTLFDQQVLKNIAPNRVAAAVRSLKGAASFNPLETAKGAYQTAFPAETEATKALRAAVKGQNTYTPLSTKNELAQAAYENLVKANMKGEGRPLALPAPDIDVPPGGFEAGAPAADANGPSGPRLLPRGNEDTFYQPQNRALTYQPGADYTVTPEGWVSPRSSTSIRQRPDLTQSAEDAKQALQKTSGRSPQKLLTYQPHPDFIGQGSDVRPADLGDAPSVSRPDYEKWDTFNLGKYNGQARGGIAHMAKGGRVMPKPKSYPALKERRV